MLLMNPFQKVMHKNSKIFKIGNKRSKGYRIQKTKKILDTDFSFQTMKRLAAESDILEKS